MSKFLKVSQVVGRGGKGLKELSKLFSRMLTFQIAGSHYMATNDAAAVHQDLTEDPVTAVESPVSTLADCIAALNAMAASYTAHIASVGTATAQGAHKAADATNVVTAPAAADQATSQTLANQLKTLINAHLIQAGVHFHNDATTALATPNASDLPSLVTLTNALFTFFQGHYNRAPYSVPYTLTGL